MKQADELLAAKDAEIARLKKALATCRRLRKKDQTAFEAWRNS